MVEVNEKAPNFTVSMAEGNGEMSEFTLEDAVGDGPVVLAFFPAAFSPGCTHEMCEFRDSLADFEELDARVYGVSVDLPYTLNAFIDDNDLNFPMLSDFNQEVIESYGVKMDEFAGFEGIAERSVFVIDDDGNVSYAWIGDNPADLPDVDEVKHAVEDAA